MVIIVRAVIVKSENDEVGLQRLVKRIQTADAKVAYEKIMFAPPMAGAGLVPPFVTNRQRVGGVGEGKGVSTFVTPVTMARLRGCAPLPQADAQLLLALFSSGKSPRSGP